LYHCADFCGAVHESEGETLMIRKGINRALVLAAATAVIGSSANAVSMISPSGLVGISGVNSATLPSLTGGTLLASMTSAFSTPSWAGTLYTTVIRETTGTLSFLYQVQVNPGGAIDNVARLTTIDFTGYTVDADYFSDGFTGFGFVSTVGVKTNPYTADRQTDNVVGFNFSNGSSDPGLAHGDTSNVVYLRTNATHFTRGSSNLIDGHVVSVNSFAPAVPSPAALIPFGVGLVAAFMRKRRS
jgi:hypothetical protein